MIMGRMTDTSSVSVIIPIRNGTSLLRECLQSLAEQELPPGLSEVLICDDGSTDDLRPTVEEFSGRLPGLRLLRQSPKGPAAARNLGFRSCNADIYVCIDSDLVCTEGFLSHLVSSFGQHPEWVAAESTVLPKGEKSLLFDAPENHGGTYVSGGGAYRADALRRAGGFDEAYPYPACEDAEIGARLLNLGAYGYVPEAIVYHPTRRVTLATHWRWRKFWKYIMINAKRYGFLSFPGRSAGRFPRLRVALAAVITLPGGRFLLACTRIRHNPKEACLACVYALFDVVCGLLALPDILFAPVPPRKNYL
ncbi:MAG: glycosyl transferase [Deltaproteobacteria bacterium]|nr:glycosyl transferase [Deltaproteobacteria bacterium]